MTAIKYVQTNTLYQAGAGSIVGATSLVLTSLTDIYGNVLTMTDFGGKGYGTCEPDTTNEEAFTFTGIVANANGTYTLTGISTALARSPYTETSGTIRQHSGGTKVVITDNVAFWNTFSNKNNNETVVGKWTLPGDNVNRPTLSSDIDSANATDLPTVGQLSRTASAGASNASLTVKGIVQMPTQAQVDARTATGSTGALLALTPDKQRSTLLSDYVVDTGIANAYVITPVPAISAYAVGQVFSFKAINANTSASTLNVNALGTKSIVRNDGVAALTTGDILTNQIVTVEYDETNFRLISSLNAQQIQNSSFNYGLDAAGTDAYAITLSPAPAAYVVGQIFAFKAGTANTAAATLNVNALGAIAIKKNLNVDTQTGDILAGQTVQVMYDGTNFQLISPISNLSANTYAAGTATRPGNTASGSQTIAHGLGKVPSRIRITAVYSDATGNIGAAFSEGVYNGTTNNCVYEQNYSTGSAGDIGTSGNSNTQIIFLLGLSTNSQAAVATFDATNITLTWTKAGTPGSATINMLWEAFA